jgi:hypothetical protein
MATAGLAINLMLWGVPGMVGASALPHLIAPDRAPTLAQTLFNAERSSGQTPSVPDALMQLIGAEAEALQIAAAALQQPTPADLAPRANAVGARVLDAVTSYARSAQAALDHAPHLP